MKALYQLVILSILFLSCNVSTEKKDNTKNKVDLVKKEPVIQEPESQKLTKEEQIACAIQAAPKEGREGAKVYGFDDKGEWVTLREGNNEFICIADDPNKKGFQIVCYHKSLEPLMARGRQLGKEGKSRQEKEKIRSEEAKSGKLKMPENPATLHIYFGEKGFYNIKTNTIENARYRYVVYIPFATQATTGLSLKPNASNHPWLMFPGKYNAHIMISPKE